MPIIKSAKKALRQNIRRRKTNLKRKEALSTVLKQYKKSPTPESLRSAYKALDKAAKTNLIKKNKANRLKSRLSKLLKTKIK